MNQRPAALFKYRFGTLGQMQNHLHVVEGRTLFFLRDPRGTLTGGARVVIEFSLANSEQMQTLRGQVITRIEGTQPGAWIEFPDSRLARRLEQGEAGLAARHQRRLGCDMHCQVKYDGLPLLGRLIDVSLHGLRIVGPTAVPRGVDVEVRIMGAEPPMPGLLGRSQVVRSDPGGDLAVRYVRTDVVARVASGKLYALMQEAWQKAPELAHSPLCCDGGNVQEPPLPHMKKAT